MGIFDWVKSKTGIWGPVLLDYYFENAWWINAIIVVYGLVLLLSWHNLSRITDALVEQILLQTRNMKKKNEKDNKPFRIHLNDFQLSWEQAAASSKFPFIARGTGLIIRRATLGNIQSMISERDLIHHGSSRLKEMGFQLERGK